MSREAVEQIRRGFEAWNRGALEEWLEGVHPEVEARAGLANQLEGGEYHGIDGLRRWWDDYHDAFDEIQLYADEIRDLGDRMLVLGHVYARGKASGLERDVPWGWVFRLRDGRIVRLESYDDPGRAVAVAEAADQGPPRT